MNDYQKYGEYSDAGSGASESVISALAFLAIGAGVGALISLLLAPRSGPELRRSIRGRVASVGREFNEQTMKIRRRTAGLAEQARSKVMPIRNAR